MQANNYSEHAFCKKLDWDSTFFGFGIGRVIDTRINYGQLATIDRFADAQAIRCLYFLCDANDPSSSEIAEESGFHLVDIRLTFIYQFPVSFTPPLIEESVRPVQAADIEDLATMARNGHRDTRFYFDKHFERPKCDALYESWIRKSCEGQAQQVFVAEAEGIPSGYITCHIEPQNAIGTIGLVGVHPAVRGRGIGAKLVQQSLGWFFTQGTHVVKVTTQARNIAAQRLYQREGFLSDEVGLWFHKWY